jgi:hypothetical protein
MSITMYFLKSFSIIASTLSSDGKILIEQFTFPNDYDDLSLDWNSIIIGL